MYTTKKEAQNAKPHNKEVANTIIRQMKATNINLMMYMGFRKPYIIENGIYFTVSGVSFDGQVEITINSTDKYDIKFIKAVKKIDKETSAMIGDIFYKTEFKVVMRSKDVSSDELMPLLENIIENKRKKQK